MGLAHTVWATAQPITNQEIDRTLLMLYHMMFFHVVGAFIGLVPLIASHFAREVHKGIGIFITAFVFGGVFPMISLPIIFFTSSLATLYFLVAGRPSGAPNEPARCRRCGNLVEPGARICDGCLNRDEEDY
jgi:hypothetical protein